MYQLDPNAMEFSEKLEKNIPVRAILGESDYIVAETRQKLIDMVSVVCAQMQGDDVYWKPETGRIENRRNRRVKQGIEDAYVVSDETQQGRSFEGNDIGRIDLSIRLKDEPNVPWTIYEGLNLTGATQSQMEYWDKHLTKLLGNYDPHGYVFSLLVSYVDCKKKDFSATVQSYYDHIRKYAPDGCTVRDEVAYYDLGNDYRESNQYIKCITCRYDRGGAFTTVYHFFVHMDTAPALVAP